MLQGPLLEGETLRATGKVEIPLPEDDLVAFTILLYIIHGKTSQVPRTISVELLATLSILVDKYELLEVVGIYSDVWILANYRFRKIELAVPDDIDLLWLSISWVFRKEEIFENITKVMIRNSSQIHIEKMVALLALNDFELPIPPEVFSKLFPFFDHAECCLSIYIDTMNSKRAVLTRAAINYVQFFVTRYTSSEHIHCDAKPPQDPLIPSDPETHIAQRLACDAMVLGTLTKSCASMRFSPDSSPPGLFALRKPYSAVSCKEVLEQISAMKVESLCDRLCPRIGQDPGHRVKETLHEILRNNVCFKGLDLKDFVVKGR